MPSARFTTGRLLLSRGVFALLESHPAGSLAAVFALVARHAAGDWGDVPPADAEENELSVRAGFRVLSSYELCDRRVWVITEADRSATTVLFPDEY